MLECDWVLNLFRENLKEASQQDFGCTRATARIPFALEHPHMGTGPTPLAQVRQHSAGILIVLKDKGNAFFFNVKLSWVVLVLQTVHMRFAP